MLPKIVFDKTKNPQKSPYQPMDLKNLGKKSANQKSQDICQIFVIYTKNPLAMVWI